MIIITGMDNTGKTTTVERLSNDFDLIQMKSLGGGKVSKKAHDAWFNKQIRLVKAGSIIIYDRFNIMEEQVYGKVIRDKPKYDFDGEEFKTLLEVDPLIIYTRIPNEKMMQFGDREQMPGVIERANELLMAYDDLIFNMINRGFAICTYDWTQENAYEDLMEVVKAYQAIKQ